MTHNEMMNLKKNLETIKPLMDELSSMITKHNEDFEKAVINSGLSAAEIKIILGK